MDDEADEKREDDDEIDDVPKALAPVSERAVDSELVQFVGDEAEEKEVVDTGDETEEENDEDLGSRVEPAVGLEQDVVEIGGVGAELGAIAAGEKCAEDQIAVDELDDPNREADHVEEEKVLKFDVGRIGVLAPLLFRSTVAVDADVDADSGQVPDLLAKVTIRVRVAGDATKRLHVPVNGARLKVQHFPHQRARQEKRQIQR